MTPRSFVQVDVFTERAFLGNPVAVVLDAEGMSDDEMQSFGRWTNLSETVFVLPSDSADYRLRIFTPKSELPFAGHPTVGAGHAVREAGLVDRGRSHFVQECAAGLIPLAVDEGGAVHARVPRAKVVELDFDPGHFAAAVGGVGVADPMAIHVGPTWIVARVGPASLFALTPSMAVMAALNTATSTTGITLYAVLERESGPEVHVRSFAPADGVPEDPVCGSGNAAVAAHLRVTGRLDQVGTSYVARQGRSIGRDGFVSVTVEGEDIWIGGRAVTVIRGTTITG